MNTSTACFLFLAGFCLIHSSLGQTTAAAGTTAAEGNDTEDATTAAKEVAKKAAPAPAPAPKAANPVAGQAAAVTTQAAATTTKKSGATGLKDVAKFANLLAASLFFLLPVLM